MLLCCIIDDSFFIRETLSKMIREASHEVTDTFDSSDTFLANIDKINPDVIFLDIILPKTTGLELLKPIIKKWPTIKVVMLSGMTQGNTISTALRLGATEFISKPISRERLRDLLDKFSDESKIPSVEELSTIGVSTELISYFLLELTSHASSNLRAVIINQGRSILENFEKDIPNMIITDMEKLTLEPNPGLWGVYSEDQVFNNLKVIVQDLKMELQFLYQKEFINTLFEQSMLTMASKKKFLKLFDLVSPTKIGLPELPQLGDISIDKITAAGTTFEELEKAITISVYVSGMMGPQVQTHLNSDLLDENDALKNSIFYSTLIGMKENFQEGLFGPLPVSSNSDQYLSALVYTYKLHTYEEMKKFGSTEPNIVLLSFYFTSAAEGIISDYDRLSFIIKTRLSTINYTEELDRITMRPILGDVINFILE